MDPPEYPMSNSTLERLNQLLTGRTIRKVQPTKDALCELTNGSLCALTLDNGQVVTIYSTDPHAWIRVTKDDYYESLNDLFEAYHEDHKYYETQNQGEPTPKPSIQEEKDHFVLSHPYGETYQIKTRSLSQWELTVLRDPEGKKRLLSAPVLDRYWSNLFFHRSDCPIHLIKP